MEKVKQWTPIKMVIMLFLHSAILVKFLLYVSKRGLIFYLQKSYATIDLKLPNNLWLKILRNQELPETP